MDLPTPRTAMAMPWLLLLCLGTTAVPRALAQSTLGFISIDCGGETGYVNGATTLLYTTDAGFIDAYAGSNHNVSAEYIVPSVAQMWYTVRSFPSGARNCYTLGSLVAGLKYLIRGQFYYGNYDGLNRPPTFDVYVGVDFWTTVNAKADPVAITEAIVVVPSDSVQVCLVNTGGGVPFISGLDLRPLKNKLYPLANATQGLVLLHRIDFGLANGSNAIRYPDDPYDRLWDPFPDSTTHPWAVISTEMKVQIDDDEFQPPQAVMQTAVTPMNVPANIEFTLDLVSSPGYRSLGYSHTLYFSELQQRGNALREYNIYRNGELSYMGAYTPPYLDDGYVFSAWAFEVSHYRVSLKPTANSKLPPIVNAIELFSVIPTTTLGTNSLDVSAITSIKKIYQVHKNWMGDPCVPDTLLWDGLTCSYVVKPPIISNVNLSFSDLNGTISHYFTNLKDVKYLDLSNNNLIGSIPDTLSQLPLLKYLDLSNNKLNGSIPYGLLKKVQADSLEIRYGNNPDLCSNGNSCQPAEGDDKLAIHIVVPLVVIMVLVLQAMLCFCWQRRRKQAISICIWRKRSSLNKTTRLYTACSEDIEDIKSLLLDTSVIRIATSNFSEENKLGEGGFGQVYKGMMPYGQEIAVKRLSEESKQGLHELKNELLLIAKLQHRNLVKLIGACLDGEDKLLVYEYIPKKSLDAFIFDEEKRRELSWDTRYKIICGIARGLVYLHDESRIKVIHRDLKPSNILLEMDMNPKISDFGLASVFEGDHTKHITRRVAGTYGYMAPEYAVLGHVSTKSDVFSFGMIILEIVTGRRNSVSSETMMAEHLLTYVWENWTRGTKAEIVDPSLHYNFSESNVLIKCVHIGLLCVQEDPSDRPGMSNVILMLVGKSTTLPAPSRPAFLFRLNHENHVHGGLSDILDGSNKANQSFNELTITELESR